MLGLSCVILCAFMCLFSHPFLNFTKGSAIFFWSFHFFLLLFAFGFGLFSSAYFNITLAIVCAELPQVKHTRAFPWIALYVSSYICTSAFVNLPLNCRAAINVSCAVRSFINSNICFLSISQIFHRLKFLQSTPIGTGYSTHKSHLAYHIPLRPPVFAPMIAAGAVISFAITLPQQVNVGFSFIPCT